MIARRSRTRGSMLPAAGEPAAPFGVVDIGSNSIRLVVYERLCRAPIALFNEKSVCALGRALATTGRLGRAEMDSALHALRRFAHIADALRVGEVEYVATEAVRSAENGAEFLAEAERAVGRPIAILSGHEEAQTAAAGIAYSFHRPLGVVGDLGGGSVDLSGVAPDGPCGPYASLPIGTLPVTRMLLDRELPGIPEAIRARGLAHTPKAALSRGVAGTVGGTVIVNLPGSTGGVKDGLAVLDELLEHLVAQVAGGGDHE